MDRIVEKIESRLPAQPKILRVAAYARVSSGKDAMLHSLSAQVSYYSELIQNHPGWHYCGVFSDEALTGTKEDRPGFQKLLAECRAGNVDLVITKSISRFARNTVTLLETVRELKSLGVDIYFEEQNIHTMSADGELMLTILASYAQEESRSASENQKWRVRKNFEEGKPWTGSVLGYRYENGVYIVKPNEAEIVREIFFCYLSGMGIEAIMKKLNAEGRTTRNGKAWARSGVHRILNNYSYTGNLLLQTTFREDHITKRRRTNRGELPMYTDAGISGLNTKKRDGFNQMVSDALAGKIDLIITKSVSRFARNTVDSLTTIRKLKEHGVEVYFEEQNIWTFDSKGELLITIMSSLAQEESRSISENVTWGQRKRFADGKLSLGYKNFLGYEKGPDKDHPLVIIEKQAEIVRRIYRMFIEGKTPFAIAKTLTAESIPTPGGKTKWGAAVIESILTNEKYKGSALLQKSLTIDFLQKKMKQNEGEVPQYFIQQSHEAITQPQE